MRNIKSVQFLFVILTMLIAPNVFSQNESDYAKGWWGFLGGGLGFVMIDPKGAENPISAEFEVNPGFPEADKKGFTLHGRGGLGWYINDSFVLDLMAGWQYSKVSGSAPEGASDDVSIKHQTGFLDISPRFRFGRSGRFQLGPLAKMHFGTDTAYEESEGQNFGNKPMTWYLGAHANYDIPSTSRATLYRIGLQAMTDLNDSRAYYRVLGIFEIGFHLFGGTKSYADEVDETVKEEDDFFVDPVALEEDLPPEPEYVPPPPPVFEEARPSVAEVRGKCTIRFPAVAFNFDTNMSHLKEDRARQYLRELGGWLSSHNGLWQAATAEGHTDVRGGDRINVPLSEGRARTFRIHLTEGGAPGNMINYVGKSSYEPADPNANNQSDPNAWRLNRRTEIVFEGANCDEIKSKVNDLNNKYVY